MTELSGSGHDSSYYDDRSDHERERHKEKKKKKKKKSEKEKHLDDEERRKRKVKEQRQRRWPGRPPRGPHGEPGRRTQAECACVAGGGEGCSVGSKTQTAEASRLSSRILGVLFLSGPCEGLREEGARLEEGLGGGFP